MRQLKDIPEFKNEDEEADFWATHDTDDYVDLSNLTEVSFPNLKRTEGLVPVFLDASAERELKVLAKERSVDLSILAAQYINEGIRRDAHPASR